MRITLIVSMIVILFYWCVIFFAGVSVHGTGISKSTEEKYIRNLKNGYMIREDHFHFTDAGDSLSLISKHPFSSIDPIYKWYISDVGQIKRHTRLCDMLDSMSNAYKNDANNRENKLK